MLDVFDLLLTLEAPLNTRVHTVMILLLVELQNTGIVIVGRLVVQGVDDRLPFREGQMSMVPCAQCSQLLVRQLLVALSLALANDIAGH